MVSGISLGSYRERQENFQFKHSFADWPGVTCMTSSNECNCFTLSYCQIIPVCEVKFADINARQKPCLFTEVVQKAR